MNILSNVFATLIVAVAPVSTDTSDVVQSIAKKEVIQTIRKETIQEKSEHIAREKILARWKEKQISKWKHLPQDEFIINASAYTSAADECGKDDGITASGLVVKEEQTLACPPEYPFGVRIAIDGMGLFTCEDRGGAIKGNHFDIYMKTKVEAFAFGRQTLTARVIL